MSGSSLASEPWLTKREVARKLRVSPRTVERLRLPYTRVGGQNRYRMSQVESALAGHKDLPDNVIPAPTRAERESCMSVFRRGDAWAAKFVLRGRQIWVPGGPFATKRQAQQAEQRHRERLSTRRTEETCASFAERWLDEWPRPSPGTRETYRRAARRFAEHFGPTPLGEVERLSARTWALQVPRNISKPIATMYEDACNVGLIETNPFSNLRLPVTEKTQDVLPPSLDEYRELVAACTVLGGYGPEFRAIVQFAAWTGVRIGELATLQWHDVDGDFIWIRRARKNDGSIAKPKNGRERKIVYLEPARVLDQVPRRENSEFIFHSPSGVPLTKNNHHYAWRQVRAASGVMQARQEVGLPNVRFHDLRHFCATQLLELGLSHFDVSVQLGHEDGGALVMRRYGHPSKEAARGRLLQAFSPQEAKIGSETGSSATN